MSMTRDHMIETEEDDEELAMETIANRDAVVIAIADVLRITHALRLADVALRSELGGLEPVTHDPEEIAALVEQIGDCFDLLCCRLEARGMYPPA
jgi:hypothetical protein